MDAKNESKAHFEKTAAVALGQAAGFAFSFFIPVFLSRRLTVESYGTYKQIFLIQWFFLMTLQMGLDSGLFYFMKRDPKRAALYSLNALLAELGLALVVASALLVAREPLGRLFHNPELAGLVPALGALVVFSIPSQHLEHYLMVLDRIRSNVVVFSASELAKAAAVIGGLAWLGSLEAAVLGVAAIGLLRCLFLVGLNLRSLRREGVPLRELRPALGEQVAFGLPLGLSQLVSVLYKMDRFVIASLFPVREFTLYSVGALDVPLVPGVSNTMSDLMSFDMVESGTRRDFARIQYLWHTTKRKIALIQIPIAIYLIAFAGPVITFVYSEKYAESAPYFRMFMVLFLLTTFDADILFRTFADNRRFMKAQLASSLGGLALAIGFAYALGPMGALVGKCLADTVGTLVKLGLARSLLHLRVGELFLWGELGKIAGASVVAALAAHLAARQGLPYPAARVAVSLATYGAVFGGLSLAIGILKPDETLYLRGKLGLG